MTMKNKTAQLTMPEIAPPAVQVTLKFGTLSSGLIKAELQRVKTLLPNYSVSTTDVVRTLLLESLKSLAKETNTTLPQHFDTYQ
jgi:hypothetical protein